MARGHPGTRGHPRPGEGQALGKGPREAPGWGRTAPCRGRSGDIAVRLREDAPRCAEHPGAKEHPWPGLCRGRAAHLPRGPPPVPSILPVPGTHISSRRPARPPRSWPRRSPARHGPARPPPSGSGPSAPPPSRTTPPTAGGAGRTTAGAAGGGRDPPGSELPPMPGVPRAPPGEAPRSPCAPRPVRHGGTAGAGPFPGDVSRPGGHFWPPQDPPHPLQDPRSPVVWPHPTVSPCPRHGHWDHWAPAKCQPLGAAWAGQELWPKRRGQGDKRALPNGEVFVIRPVGGRGPAAPGWWLRGDAPVLLPVAPRRAWPSP